METLIELWSKIPNISIDAMIFGVPLKKWMLYGAFWHLIPASIGVIRIFFKNLKVSLQDFRVEGSELIAVWWDSRVVMPVLDLKQRPPRTVEFYDLVKRLRVLFLIPAFQFLICKCLGREFKGRKLRDFEAVTESFDEVRPIFFGFSVSFIFSVLFLVLFYIEKTPPNEFLSIFIEFSILFFTGYFLYSALILFVTAFLLIGEYLLPVFMIFGYIVQLAIFSLVGCLFLIGGSALYFISYSGYALFFVAIVELWFANIGILVFYALNN